MKYRNARVLWQDNLLERAFDHQSVAFKSKSVTFKSKSVPFKSKYVAFKSKLCPSNQNLCPSNKNLCPSNQNLCPYITITTTTSTSKTDAWLIKDISAQENLSNRGTPLSFHRYEAITETIFHPHKQKMLHLLFSSSSITYISNLPFTIFNLLIYSCHLVYNYSNVLFIHLSHVEGHRLVFERSFK